MLMVTVVLIGKMCGGGLVKPVVKSFFKETKDNSFDKKLKIYIEKLNKTLPKKIADGFTAVHTSYADKKMINTYSYTRVDTTFPSQNFKKEMTNVNCNRPKPRTFLDMNIEIYYQVLDNENKEISVFKISKNDCAPTNAPPPLLQKEKK